MKTEPVTQLWVVVALFEPLPVGAEFDRRAWPAHITLASNFVVDGSGDSLVRAVRTVCGEQHGPISIRFGDRTMFGRDRDVSVQLVESAQLIRLHERLADVLEIAPGFSASSPDYWRGGYRPHMTHVPRVVVREGGAARLSDIAVAALNDRTAFVTGVVALRGDDE